MRAAAERQVRQSAQAASTLGIDSTPSFLIGPTGGPGRFQPGDLTPGSFDRSIDEALEPMTRAIAALALLGLAISAYLTWVHYAGIEPVCTGISDCERVQSSDYAELVGIPVAVLGFVGYAAILASLGARRGDGGCSRTWRSRSAPISPGPRCSRSRRSASGAW